jgi:hypothetical protein
MIVTTWVEDGDFGPAVAVAMRTVPGMNVREHFRARAKRVKAEKDVIAWELVKAQRPPIPCTCLLTRVAPSNGLDDDNLAGALKSVRDAVAAWLGVDDAKRETVRYRYAQTRGPWGVRIQFGPPVRGAQHVLEF